MGAEQVTMRNLVVMDVSDTGVVLKGTIPGPKGALAKLTKVSESRHFQPLLGKEGLDKVAVAHGQVALPAQAEKEGETKTSGEPSLVEEKAEEPRQ